MRAGRHAALLVMGATLALLVGVEGKSPADARSEPGMAGSTADAVAYQINPGHDGSQPDDSLAPALTRAWMIDFDAPDPTAPQGPVSYPLIVNGKVYVIADSLAQGPILTSIPQPEACCGRTSASPAAAASVTSPSFTMDCSTTRSTGATQAWCTTRSRET